MVREFILYQSNTKKKREKNLRDRLGQTGGQLVPPSDERTTAEENQPVGQREFSFTRLEDRNRETDQINNQ